MKLDKSTWKHKKTSWEFGLFDEESFKYKNAYLDDANSSILWSILTQFVTLSPFLILDFNGVLEVLHSPSLGQNSSLNDTFFF